MFRFFRNIRQQLLVENKTVRYLKYATGEFILVVLGILVALTLTTGTLSADHHESERPPNILFIAIDDMKPIGSVFAEDPGNFLQRVVLPLLSSKMLKNPFDNPSDPLSWPGRGKKLYLRDALILPALPRKGTPHM